MESSRYIVWIKRFLPVVLLIAGWMAWDSYEQHRIAREMAEDKKLATVTAYLYLGAARYRADSLEYIEYRDSLLESMAVTPEHLRLYAAGEDINPHRYKRYVKFLGELTDSLYRVEDSIRKVTDSLARDSLGSDTVANDLRIIETPSTAIPIQ